MMVRCGKQGQAGQRHDWAQHGEGEHDDDEAVEELRYEARANDDAREWGYDGDYGWAGPADGDGTIMDIMTYGPNTTPKAA